MGENTPALERIGQIDISDGEWHPVPDSLVGMCTVWANQDYTTSGAIVSVDRRTPETSLGIILKGR